MKTTNQLFTIMTIVLLLFSSSSCRKNIKPVGHIITKNGHIITLNVNTALINSSNIDSTANFGQTRGIPNRDYTVDAKLGDSITWQGFSTSNENDKVYITKIKHKKGPNVFKNKELNGNKKVKGKLTDTTECENLYKYTIHFTVVRNTKKDKYEIDPKLRVKKTE